MKILSIMVGIAMIALACHDVFHTLFHPAGRGAMSDQLSRWMWRLTHAISKVKNDFITLGGPLIFLSIVATWAFLVVLGFTLIYDTNMPAFSLAPAISPARHVGWFDAANISLGSLITLAGDVSARSRAFRLLMSIEAVLGFGLLTASVSWLLSIYPVLEQRHSLAHKATLLHEAERLSGISIFSLPCAELRVIVDGFTADMISLRNRMVQFPISYYFRGGNKKTSFAGILGYIRSVGERAAESHDPAVRLAGTMLGGAVIDFLKLVAEVYLRMPCDDLNSIVQAFAQDHHREIVSYEASRSSEAKENI